MKTTKAQSFPLAWPQSQARTKIRATSRFGERTVAKSLAALKQELNRLIGAVYIVISTNIPLKDNGDPYSDPGKMKDPGVAVYFHLNGTPYCLPCDRWNSVEDNLYAVAKHIEAMRGMDRWGVGSVEQNFAGFRELPATASEPNWWDVLQISANADPVTINAAHRKLAMDVHPDRGGSAERMQQINIARDKALSRVAS